MHRKHVRFWPKADVGALSFYEKPLRGRIEQKRMMLDVPCRSGPSKTWIKLKNRRSCRNSRYCGEGDKVATGFFFFLFGADGAEKAYQLVMNAFEPAIALAKNQVVAYAGISAAYGMVSRRSESHEYAKRGLAELAEMRRLASNVDRNRVFPPEALDQMEQHLRSLLAW
jgi:hypothetical protein